jgi:hypothetical protein
MNEIAALLTSFSHLQNIAKTFLELRDLEKLNSKVIELQQAIITAQQQTMTIQQSYTMLEAKTRDLEAQCVRLKDWSGEKQNYTCRAVAQGIFAYVHKEVVTDFENAHKYCSTCFENGEKSILQQSDEGGLDWSLNCPRCKFKVRFKYYRNSS